MPRCRIDIEASPTFQRHLRYYQRRYRNTFDDLRQALQRIEADPEQAAHARSLVRFGAHAVLKYRFKHSDAGHGGRGGYRLIAAYDRAGGVLYPIILFAKVDLDDVSAEAVRHAVHELREALQKDQQE